MGGLPFHRLQQTRDSLYGHAGNRLQAKTDEIPSSFDQITDNKMTTFQGFWVQTAVKLPRTLWWMLTLKVGENWLHLLYQTKLQEAWTKRFTKTLNSSATRHKATTAAQHLLEHCNGSFPKTDFSQATQSAGPGGETGINWCPLVLPSLSFPSFISFVFTCNRNCK